MFEIKNKESFPEREETVLAFWDREKIFELSLKERQKGPLFSFYDGPPFATGLPHYGHLLAGTIKDAIPRYWSMKGYYVPRRFGWDCHGLPVENEIEKAQELSGAPEIEQFGIAKFNEECRSIVLRYTEQWERTVRRMGRWVDFKGAYKTMDKDYMEKVWWVFGELYKKGLVYEGLKVMPYSAKLGTPISNFEANLNYRDVDDPSLIVSFPLIDEPDVSLLAWTTTPWTLPSNLAVCVNADLDYVVVHDYKTDQKYIVAEGRMRALFPEHKILKVFKGRELKGKKYKPLFEYFHDKNAFRVITDDFVSIEDGTGVVHMAPAFGEADFFACAKEGIEPVCPVDQNGKFTAQVPEYAGLFVKDADKEIIKRLKGDKRVFSHTQIHHRYPFCWRSDTPLIYKAVRTWFVAVEKIKDKILQANSQIHWVPGHIKEGRFGKWLENARDWAISRNRYWGTPIPLWRSDDGEIVAISSVKDLEDRTGRDVIDLHRHFIDDLTFVQDGKTFKRIPEVFDCWFESGSMPYASVKDLQGFPADFIGEGIDQTRAWFYTLTVLSAALFDKPAFKNVVVNGILLAEDGSKMSKRLKNYPEPDIVIEKYGADAIRFYLLSSPAVIANDLHFSAKGVEQVMRQVLIPLWNSYVFFATYAKIYNWKPNKCEPKSDIDRWMLSITQKLIEDVAGAMDKYELQEAVLPLIAYIDQLTNWYIRRSRGRFWEDEECDDRNEAFYTLYTVLMTFAKVSAPFIPFIAEAIYHQMRHGHDLLSVHLCDFPKSDKSLRDLNLESEMKEVQAIVSLGHGLRKESKLKVRQPLAKAYLICADKARLKAMKAQENLICDELNVKKISFSDDESEYVTFTVKPNFRVLGKKVGPLMNAVQKKLAHLPAKELSELMAGDGVVITVDGEKVELTKEDVVIERSVKTGGVAATEGGITLVLDTELTDALILEGIARELINKINTMRKELDFAITDRIHLRLKTTPKVEEAMCTHRDFICHEVLATNFEFGPCTGDEVDINGEPTTIEVSRVNL
jgi:isoleucyl-tRNA synthetase